MTASKISSSIVTNRLANPPVYNALGAAADCKLRTIAGSMEVATTSLDEIGDVILLAPVRGNERVVSLKLFSDALDSDNAITVDVGLYKNVSADGTAATVVDVDAYASGITDLRAGSKTGVEVMCEARDISKIGQTVAADGGESAHNAERYIAITVAAAATSADAGTLSWVVVVAEA